MATFSEKATYGLGPVRNRNTIRCVVPETRREEITKDFFVEDILFGLLDFGPREVLSFQHFPSQGTFEITFRTTEWLQLGKKRIGDNVSNELLDGLKFSASDVYATVIVHAFNPHTSGEDIATFLRRYCAEVRDGVKLFDKYDLWNCRRRYKVRFRMKADGKTVVYPPHSFYLGPDRCHVIIEGQPGACWKCGAVGHRMAECKLRKCRHCGSGEHMAAGCHVRKTCSLCGSSQHLFRLCPRRGKEAEDSSEATDSKTVGFGESTVVGDDTIYCESKVASNVVLGNWAHVVAEGSPFVFAGDGSSVLGVKPIVGGVRDKNNGGKAKGKSKYGLSAKKKSRKEMVIAHGGEIEPGAGTKRVMKISDEEEGTDAEEAGTSGLRRRISVRSAGSELPLVPDLAVALAPDPALAPASDLVPPTGPARASAPTPASAPAGPVPAGKKVAVLVVEPEVHAAALEETAVDAGADETRLEEEVDSGGSEEVFSLATPSLEMDSWVDQNLLDLMGT